MENPLPKVGVGIIIFKDGKVLMGKRKGSHGEGSYAWPGGHLEYMESISDCAKREVMEETGMKIKNIRFLRLFNFKTGEKHYADIGLVSDWESGEPMLLEPDRCEGWAWYDPENIPQPVFETIPSYLDALKTGRNFYDA